jgi:DNA transformation protein
MVASDDFAEFLREQLAPIGHLTMRRMFGKTGVFCDGVMFGMVTDNMLYLRVDDHNRAAFKEAESFPPLNYEKKGCTIDLSFWRAPERLFDEPDELVAWARLSAGGGASGRGEERTDGTKGKIEAATHLVAGLSLIPAAIVHWNTVYLDRVTRRLRARGTTVPDGLLAHVAPLGWQHIGLTGDYVWTAPVVTQFEESLPDRPTGALHSTRGVAITRRFNRRRAAL